MLTGAIPIPLFYLDQYSSKLQAVLYVPVENRIENISSSSSSSSLSSSSSSRFLLKIFENARKKKKKKKHTREETDFKF